MDIKKVEAIWLAAAINTYEICKSKKDWQLEDIYFNQSKIIEDGRKIIKDELPATLASQQCCAYTSYSHYKYLVAKDTLRRISYNGEFHEEKERPVLDKDMIISTSHGEIKCGDLYDFIDREFSPVIKEKLDEDYARFDIDSIFQYIKDYGGKKFIAVEKAGERKEEMKEHRLRGIGARKMLVDISEEIKSFMPKYSKVDISGWINQGQRVDYYIWSELRKSGKEEFPSSMSIFAEKNADKFQLRIGVEARDSKCKSPEDYLRHNRLLEKENTNPQLKYLVGGSLSGGLEFFTLSNRDLKKEIDNGNYKKVQICKIISQDDLRNKSGKEIIELIVQAMDELEPFYDLSVSGEESKPGNKEGESLDMIQENMAYYQGKFDKNMILYGPPGTGKTYHTALYALAICENQSLETLKSEPYNQVLDRFNALKEKGQISFTSFHQSYGYEEFIEGIKPLISVEDDSDEGDIKYEYSEGIFKRFCDAAGEVRVKLSPEQLNENPKVWIMLLDGTGESQLKRKCFNNNYIKIGWPNHEEKIKEETPNLRDKERKSLLNFQDEMEIGDIVLVQKKRAGIIDAIGIITSPYRFDNDEKFPRTRDVRWIKTGINENILHLNKNTMLGTNVVYSSSRIDIKDVMHLIEKYTDNEDISIDKNNKPYVFIIDEINRGNISKIFGELITLIEDTKRVGADEEMKVILPYTGDEFGVPNNVYILGTMNTADRSIALIDTALRRRFKFIEMMPDTDVLREIGADKIKLKDGGEELDLASMLDTINQRIECLYDREHTIGHAFFTELKDSPTIDMLADIFSKSVIPLLQEYFYEDYNKIQLVLGDNAKSEDKFKFILDAPMNTREVFKGNPDFDLPDRKYSIQEEAFYQIESYLQISK